MAVLLFKLRYVPDDEAQDIRDLLNENNIEFYETSAGVMGISMPGIWLRDESKLVTARALIDAYQQQRTKEMRRAYRDQLAAGESRSMWQIFKEAPLRFLGYLLTIVVLIYFTVAGFYYLV